MHVNKQVVKYPFATPLHAMGAWLALLAATCVNADTLHSCIYTGTATCQGEPGFCTQEVMAPENCAFQLTIQGSGCKALPTMFGMSSSTSVYCAADDEHLKLLEIKDTWRRQCTYSNNDCTAWVGKEPNCVEYNYANTAGSGSDVCTSLCATVDCGACVPYLQSTGELGSAAQTAFAEMVVGSAWYDPAIYATFRTTCGLPSGAPTIDTDIMGSHFYDLSGNLPVLTLPTTTTTTTTTTTVVPATVTMVVALDIDLASLSPPDLTSVKEQLLEAAADAGRFDSADVEKIELVQRAPTPVPTPAPTPAPPSTTPTSTTATNTTASSTTATNTTTTATTSTFACDYFNPGKTPYSFEECWNHFGGRYSDLAEPCCGSGHMHCHICLACGFLDGQALNALHYTGEFVCRNGGVSSTQSSTVPTIPVSTPGMINHPINATITFNVYEYSTYSRALVLVDLDPTIWTLQDDSEIAIATAADFTVDVSFWGRNNVVAVVDEMTFFISKTGPSSPESEGSDSANMDDDILAGSNADAEISCALDDNCMDGFLFLGLVGGGVLLFCIICSCICFCLCCKQSQNSNSNTQPLPTTNNADYSPRTPDEADAVDVAVVGKVGARVDDDAGSRVQEQCGGVQTEGGSSGDTGAIDHTDIINASFDAHKNARFGVENVGVASGAPGLVDSASADTPQEITRCSTCHAKTQFCMCNMPKNNRANTSV